MRRRARSSAFSLLELLVVIGLFAILMVLAVPASQSILLSNDITTAASAIGSQLGAARQQAVTSNRNVEIRFYHYASGNEPARYRALQTFIAGRDTEPEWTPVSRVEKLPTRATIADSAPLSPVLAAQTRLGSGPTIAPAGTAYTYSRILFRPDGSAFLPANPGNPDNWFLTVVAAQPDLINAPTLPPNHAVLQLRPGTGTSHIFRP